MNQVHKLQASLKVRGHYAGSIDSEFGPLTLAGVVESEGAPLAMRLAAGEFGVSEIYKSRHNPRILAYHATTSLDAKQDEVHWCSSFVNWCVEKSGKRGTKSAAAASWLKWGVASDGRVGDIVVIRRTGGNHVGFVAHITSGHVWILGGNQSNSVNVKAFSRDLVRGYRRAAK